MGLRAVIAGGGIGGLTAALCLAQAGMAAVVVEQAPDLREVGAGLQMSPNAMKVFRALNLEAPIAQAAVRPERIEMRWGRGGGTIFSIPLGVEAERRWGAPYLHIHRADLLNVLVRALQDRAAGAVLLNRRIVSCRQTPDRVEALLEDGAAVTGDLLIGADGVRSTIRAQMLGPQEPRFTGCVAWRAVVPMAALEELVPPPAACVWVGEGRHAVTYRLRRGELANFVGVVEQDAWRGESWTEPGDRAEALAQFRGFHPIVLRLIERAEAHFRWALFDREPLDRWTEGRVALLGDACHPMLPFMAQGAAMAIEDAWVLATCLKAAAAVPAALIAYERARLERTAKMQSAARANARIFHRRTALGKLATYGPMWLGARLAPALVRRRQDWIYGWEP